MRQYSTALIPSPASTITASTSSALAELDGAARLLGMPFGLPSLLSIFIKTCVEKLPVGHAYFLFVFSSELRSGLQRMPLAEYDLIAF